MEKRSKQFHCHEFSFDIDLQSLHELAADALVFLEEPGEFLDASTRGFVSLLQHLLAELRFGQDRLEFLIQLVTQARTQPVLSACRKQ